MPILAQLRPKSGPKPWSNTIQILKKAISGQALSIFYTEKNIQIIFVVEKLGLCFGKMLWLIPHIICQFKNVGILPLSFIPLTIQLYCS